MKVVYIGCVKFSEDILKKLLNLNANISGILTKRNSIFNSDFVDLSHIAKRHRIPHKYVTNINAKENLKWIDKIKPDIIFCFGFSQILQKDILSKAPRGVLGFHSTKLPQNRGRHPIAWSLVLGLTKTASTFFFLDEGIDSGDILDQKEINIEYADNVLSLYNKITQTASKQIEGFLPKLQDRTFNSIAQDHAKATYWRKRNKKDGEIDFRMSSRAIYNLIRGLSKPYVGAHLFYRNKEVKIWEAKEVKLKLENVEYGKILDMKDNQVLVKCSDNAVLLTKHEFKKLPTVGEYII